MTLEPSGIVQRPHLTTQTNTTVPIHVSLLLARQPLYEHSCTALPTAVCAQVSAAGLTAARYHTSLLFLLELPTLANPSRPIVQNVSIAVVAIVSAVPVAARCTLDAAQPSSLTAILR